MSELFSVSYGWLSVVRRKHVLSRLKSGFLLTCIIQGPSSLFEWGLVLVGYVLV